MDVQREFAAALRRVNANTERRCEEALLGLGIEPAPKPHPGEAFGYQLGLLARAWNESMAAVARGIQAALR